MMGRKGKEGQEDRKEHRKGEAMKKGEGPCLPIF